MSSGLRFTLDVDGSSPDTFAVVSFHYTGSYSSLFRLDVSVSGAYFTTLGYEKATGNFRSFQNQDIETILTTLLAENGVTEYSRRTRAVKSLPEQNQKIK